MSSFREQMRGFPSWQMAVICMIRFSEPIAFTSLFPYVYFMVRDFHITKDPSQISKYTGLIAASFAISQFSCCIHWGRLSDRIGRKPVLIIGLCGSASCLLAFGFANNFYIALIARGLAGALNGNVAVIQTTVGEIVKERKHQALAFAMIPFFWNVGCVIGPLIGGSKYLTRPRMDKEDTVVFASSSFYESFITKHPYALSNVVVSSLLLVSATSGFLFLEETHAEAKTKYDIGLAIGDSIRGFLGFKIPKRAWEATNSPTRNIETSPLNNERSNTYAAGLGYEEADQSVSPSGSLSKTSVKSEKPMSLWTALRNRDIFTHKVLGTGLAYFVIVFHTLVHAEFIPVFLAGSFQRDHLSFPWHIKGGLSWQTQDIGNLLSTTGFVGCFMVIVIYPIMDRHIRTISGFRLACLMFPIAYFVVPYIIFTTPGYNPALPSWVYKTLLYSSSMVEIIGSSLAFPQITILVYRATKPKHRGLINSTIMSANSFARFMAPVIWGSLTSFFDERGMAQIPWNILALVGAFSVYLSFKMDEYSEDVENGEEGV
ncbi:hypothetical protein JCM33374_g1521 [Metschnikowia sp. JCM 33374]|nr:hypothetical protein JCM33374_g1521 [Metschnikowia sp. JCM 33374]